MPQAENGWSVFNVLHRWASQTAALDVGYNATAKQAGSKFVYLLNADETTAESLKGAFVVYQGKDENFFRTSNFIPNTLRPPR